jgi:HK97 family phage portal protein
VIFQSLGELGAFAEERGVVSLDVADPGVPLVDYDGGESILASAWRTQPSIRKVTSFIAANIASIPLHVYRLDGDNDRARVRDGALAELIARPTDAPGQTQMRFWERVILDGLLNDRWAVAVEQDKSGTRLVRIPPRRFRLVTDGLDRITAVRVTGSDGQARDLDPAGFLLDVGYSQSHGRGTSPVDTLAALLRESAESVSYRREVMRRAALHTGWVERETPWPKREARDNFLTSLRSFEAHAERAGGVMVLDEGMKWHDREWRPADLNDLEARRLTDVEVATAYHIAPEILGVREGTYSNVDAFRQSLYRDNLGPYIEAWEQALAPLVDILEPNSGLYVEAHLDAKLRGSFEDQARILQTSTGAPWLTRNEARARQNLPAIDGGDDLITPLNVLVGGQASPTDSGTQNQSTAPAPASKAPNGAPLVKSADLTGGWDEKAQEILRRFFARQARSVTASIGPKADWWDQDRWDRELGADLYRLAAACVEQMGRDAVRSLGLDPDQDWDQDRTLNYLKAVTASRARWVNETTRRQIEAALAAEGDIAQVFTNAENQRSTSAGRALAAAMAGFAVVEAAKQAAPGRCVKEWVTYADNPRPSHVAMNGDIAPAHAPFSNGMQWPGDPVGGADEVAGCTCSVNLYYAH